MRIHLDDATQRIDGSETITYTNRIPVSCLNPSWRGRRSIPRSIVLKSAINIIRRGIVNTNLVELRERKVLYNLACRPTIPTSVNPSVSGKKHNVRMDIRKDHVMNITMHISKPFKGLAPIF